MSNSAPVHGLTAGARFEGSHQAGCQVMVGSSSCNSAYADVSLRVALQTCNIPLMLSGIKFSEQVKPLFI